MKISTVLMSTLGITLCNYAFSETKASDTKINKIIPAKETRNWEGLSVGINGGVINTSISNEKQMGGVLPMHPLVLMLITIGNFKINFY